MAKSAATDLSFRHETPEDVAAIYALTAQAFAPMSFSDGTEADCLNTLRDDGDLVLSYVATLQDRIVGHVAFSPVFLGGVCGEWFGLGPVSVWPDMQRQGIGSRLIDAGCQIIRDNGAKGIVLIGNPKVYGSMGFVGDGDLKYRDLPSEIVQHLPFTDERPQGTLIFAKGLEV